MKKRIFRIFYCLLLCCTVTTAWILSGDSIRTPHIILDYTGDNKMVISSVGVDAEVLFVDGDTYVPAKDFKLDPSKLVPGATIPFKITLDYQSSDEELSATAVRLSIVGITVSDPRLLSKMYISITPKNEGLTSTNGREVLYKCFDKAVPIGDEDQLTYRLDIYDSTNKLIIPHNNRGAAPSELDCYLYFHSSADASYQDISMNISYFHLEQ